MQDEDKTKEQLIDELIELRQRVTKLEALKREQNMVDEGPRMRIGEILMEMGYLTQLQLERSLKKQEAKLISHMLSSKHQRLGEIMVECGIITEEQLQKALTEQEERLNNRRQSRA